jgi:hypothetical protein
MAFNKKLWATGNIITAQELNRLETALDDAFTNKAEKTDLTGKADQSALTVLLNEISVARGSFGSLTEKLNNMVISGGGSAGPLQFNTLAELQAAYPNGTTQPVWIIADNSWYYWSGTVTPPADTTAPTLTITAGGTFTGTKTVTLSANETATIYYTLDGSTPTTASLVYSSALTISATTTLKAFAKDTAGNSSAIQTVTYTLGASDTTAPTVTASPAAGTYTSAQSVTLSANETATIYYTLDGTTPTTASTIYSGPISVASTKTLQFIGKDSAGNTSAPVAATYTINIPADTTAPVLTITPAATFTATQTVTMSATDSSTFTIWYTVDGTNPTVSGTKVQYSSPVTLTATTTVKAYAVDSANNASAIQTVTYTKQVAITTLASDNFDRVDATTLGTSNSYAGGTNLTYELSGSGAVFSVVGNQAKQTGGSACAAVLDVGQADVTVQITLGTIDGGGSYGCVARWDTVNKSGIVLHTSNKQIYEYSQSGGYTSIGTTSQDFVTGDIVKMTLKGQNITVYRNGTQVGTAISAVNQTITKHGIGNYGSSTSTWDNLIITLA